jgi:hypothetical protein
MIFWARRFGAAQDVAMIAQTTSNALARRYTRCAFVTEGDNNAYTLYGRDKLFSSSNYSRYLAYMGKMGMCGPISCSLLE